jgi:two-component system LytT family sensor kinase
MKLRIYILLVFLIAFSASAFGQKEKYSKSKRTQSDTELLEKARAIQKEKPAEAIGLVEQVLKNFNKKKKKKRRVEFSTEAESYTLLGDIYANINQNKLALERYQQAVGIWRKSKGNDKPESELYYRIGQLYLKEKDAQNAEANFLRCAKMTDDKTLKQLCEEGLADVELLRGNVVRSLSQLDKIESEYELDSLSQSRISAKRSQGFIQNNDYSNAYENLEQSVNSLPKNQKLESKDVESVQLAKDEIQSNANISNQQKIAASSNFNYNSKVEGYGDVKAEGSFNFSSQKEKISVPSDLQIRENLQLASLYEEEKNLIEAEKFINISKAVIDKNTTAASIADVYKQSAELNRKNGKLDEALLDLEKYTTAKEEAITDLQNELITQIDVVKGQQQIDLVQKDFDIEEKESELLGSQLKTQKVISGFLGLLLLASLFFFYFLNKNVKEKRKANQMLLVKSLRTQMNPHFIFNALNSVNNFIAKNDEKAANKFLSEFSRLMRKVLDYSQRDFISFEEEIELNELYLKLEHFRFRDKFEYQFEKNTEVNTYDMEVPPMLIQPFIENAVWHGLRYKEGRGQLKISINDLGNVLLVKIQDNGIGRKKSAELKTANQKKYKSTGLQNVSKRIALINEIYGKNYEIEVSDFDETKEDTGTLVKIKIPK